MSEIAGHTGLRSAAGAVVHESYSFACMRCGHGWEQSYEIEHHADTDGRLFVLYVADGEVVPSPLNRPTCGNCGGHVLRIMAAGRVSGAREAAQRSTARPAVPAQDAQGGQGDQDVPAPAGREHHHWHLSDLLHPFHRRAS
ncbi:hypothetical protein ACFXAZ_12770 [Streptomyces sp. NPDC059477]|uniref:hypothetical protein n=1 Tax=Streptomyces sp. NPDC059477 TaxID=3346847 RepID=UPI0036B520B6